MTNGINNATQADIFLFLTRRNNWQSEAAAIHTNDGIITLNEFDIYITDNWKSNEMGCATPEDDIIKKFWNQFDVNTEGLFAGNHQVQNKYALDQNEIANLEKKLELYVRFDEYVKDIYPPNVLTSTRSQWLRSVKEDLSALLESYTGEADKLTAYLDQHIKGIENRNTAVYCAEEAIKGQSGLPDGYKPAEDSTLQGIIRNYCNSITDTIAPQDIKDDINKIIKAYAKTAVQGGNSEASLLAEYGYDTTQWNDLQRAKVLDCLRRYAFNQTTYSENKVLCDGYFNAYINSLDSSTPFDSIIQNSVSAFRASDFGKTLDAIVKVLQACKNGNIKSDLESTFGKAGAEAILNNLNDSGILNTIIEQIKNGTIDVTDINLEKYIVEEIYKKFIDISDGTVDNIPADKLVDFVNEELWSPYIEDAGLEETKKLAIDYCSILVAKGGEIGLHVYNRFGIDYEEKINNYTNKDDLSDAMTGLYNAIKDYDETSNKFNNTQHEDFAWWCVGGSNDGDSGEAWWQSGSNMVLNNKDEVDLEKIFYIGSTGNLVDKFAGDIKYSYSMATGDKFGDILGHTFRPSGETGKASIDVVAKIGNIIISKSTMYFEVKAGSNGGTQGAEDPGNTSVSSDPEPEIDPIKGLNSVEGISGVLGPIENISDLKDKINTVLSNIKTTLIGSYGYDEHLNSDILATFYTAQSYYNSFCNALDSFVEEYSYPASGNINTGVNVPFHYASPGSNGVNDEYDSMIINIGYCEGSAYEGWIEDSGCYSSDGIIVVNKKGDYKYGIDKSKIASKFLDIYKKYF